jgi:hypothetical protein
MALDREFPLLQKSRRWRSHSGLKALLKPDQADQLCDLEAI